MAKALSTNPPLAVDLQAVTYLHPGERGVERIDLQLSSGSVLALLGPNGSGKSTILGLVAGFLEAQQGALTVFEQQVTPGLRARIGIVFQDSSLDALMTVHETLWLHGRLFGLGGDGLRGRIDELLDLTDLQDRSGDTVETLSGGLRRRLELARAVLHRPDLVLLDEPSLGLDPDSKARLWAMLLAINTDGAAILVATNDVAEAEQYAQSVVFLEHGQIVAEGTPAELKRGLRRDSVRVEWPDAPQDLAGTLSKWSGVGQITYASRARSHSSVPGCGQRRLGLLPGRHALERARPCSAGGDPGARAGPETALRQAGSGWPGAELADTGPTW